MGLVGLPNVGKSTLFNAVTHAKALVANYPFATIDPNVGVVNVPDPRLDRLAAMYEPKAITPATLEIVDIAGLVKGASRGEGLGNAFLANIREVDAVGHIVRCFTDTQITHVDGTVDPRRDIEVINLELILADLAYIERRRAKIEKHAKGGQADAKAECAFLSHLETHLSAGQPARTFPWDGDWPHDLFLLSRKPTLYIANVSSPEDADASPDVATVRAMAAEEGAPVVVISAKLEADLAELDDEERALFADELGVTASGLDAIVKSAYTLLGLESFLTAGPKEVRAWTIPRGTKAPQAAGVIHSDFERHFIRAEVVAYDDLITAGSMANAKAKGQVRSEGKDYVMRDGDVVLFRTSA